mmetsp:Transcript_27827/g.55682  ORF Transcript_27827/g.55682 Transcript_27827/m.55682 type:complete len:126 (+) Transcript_27827:93-470(+)
MGPTLTSPLPLFSNCSLNSISPTFCAPIEAPMLGADVAAVVGCVFDALLLFWGDIDGNSPDVSEESSGSDSANELRGVEKKKRGCLLETCHAKAAAAAPGGTETNASEGDADDNDDIIAVERMIY